MKMRKNQLSQAGFTILEALIAVSIVAFGLLGLMRALSGGLAASKRGHDVTVTTLLAQKKLDELRRDYSYPGIGTTDGTFGSPNDNFDWEINVIACATGNVREISCSIYWPAAIGSLGDRDKQRCLNMISYMAQY